MLERLCRAARADPLGLGPMTALRALDSLTERDVLTATTGNSGGRIWQHRGILNVLTPLHQ